MPTDKTRYEQSVRYEVILDDGEDYTRWADIGLTTAGSIANSTTHITGAKSISFAKTAGNVAAYILRNISSAGMDLNGFASEGNLFFSIYLSSLTNVVSVNVRLLEDTSNYVTMSVLVADLAVGWNHLKVACNKSVQTGTGVDWKSVHKLAVGVTFSAAGNTLTGILVDSIRAQIPSANVEFEAFVDNVNVSGSFALKDGTAADELNILASTATAATNVIPTKLFDNAGNAITSFGGGLTSVVGGVLASGTQTADAATSTATMVIPVKIVDSAGNSMPAGNASTAPVYTMDIGGGGGGGGGSMLYMSPTDFIASYSTSSGVCLTGMPYTPVIQQFASLAVSRIDGTYSSYSRTTNAFSYTDLTTSGVLSVGGAVLSPTDLGYLVMVYGPDKGYDNSSDVIRSTEISPLNNNAVSETLVATTNVTGGTPTYYPSSVGLEMLGYADFAVQGYVQNDNSLDYLSVEVSNDPAATTWSRIYVYDCVNNTTVSGLVTASGTTNFAAMAEKLNFKSVRVNYTPGDSVNAAYIYCRRMY